MRLLLTLPLVMVLTSCGPKASTVEDYQTQDVTLPGGQIIKAEMMIDQMDLMRGMMFRTSVAPDHGMLFVHRRPGKYSYYMYQVVIPLDMIWMDAGHNIVEVVENAQPCGTPASKCPLYGGHETAQFVLELGGGMARKYSLASGQTLRW